MRKVVSLILSLVIVFGIFISTPVVVSAASASGSMSDTSRADGGTVYWDLSYDTLKGTASLVISGDGYMPNGVSEESWHSVLPNTCFITSLTIKEGVKGIMNNAFAGEARLTSVTLPRSLEKIGEYAFADTGITKINIPEKVDYISSIQFNSSIIENYTVSENNPYYKSVDGVVYSKDGTVLVAFPNGKFEDSSYSYTMPETVTEIGEFAFYGSPVKAFVVSDNVTKISKSAFMGAMNLERITLGKNVREIYDSAFIACDSLKSVYIPSTVTYLGYYAFGFIYEIYFEGIEEIFDEAGISHGDINEYTYDYETNRQLEELGYSLDNFVGIAKLNDFSICTPSGSTAEGYAGRFGFGCVKSQACPPVMLTAKSMFGGLLVSWSYSPDATGYILEKKNLLDEWEEVALIENQKTYYVDTNAFVGLRKNEYRVKAFNETGESVYSQNTVSANHYKAPELKNAVNTLIGVEVSWEEVSGVFQYYIYRKASDNAEYELIAKVSNDELSYVDASVKNGVSYTYTVSCYDAKKESPYDPDGVTSTFIEAPEITVSNDLKGVKVKWTENTLADSYCIYRKTGSDSSVLVGTGDSDDTSFVDTSAKSGTTYKYYVKACIGESKSACFTYSSQSLKYIQAPSKIKVENKTNGVQVSWNKISGATGYYVYRRTPGGSWSRIATIKSGSTVKLLDKGVKNGKKYEYTVKAVNGKITSAYVKNGVPDLYISSPKLVSVSSKKAGVTFKYSSVSGCDGYYVYRRTPNGSWQKLATVKGSTKTTYTDKTAKKGNTYIYTVRAYDGSYRSGFYSGLKIKDKY